MDEIDKNSTRKNVKIKVWELWGKGVELCQVGEKWEKRKIVYFRAVIGQTT